jgi:hypothetical protein
MLRNDLNREVFFSSGIATLSIIDLAVFVIYMLPLRRGDFSVSYGCITYNLVKQPQEFFRLHSSTSLFRFGFSVQFSCHAYRYQGSKNAAHHG